MYRAYDTFRWRRHIPSVTDYEGSRKLKTTLDSTGRGLRIHACLYAVFFRFDVNFQQII